MDVWEAVQNGGSVDLGEALNSGAVIRTPPAAADAGDGPPAATDGSAGALRVRVYDSDLFDNDEAGEVTLLLRDLTEGDNELRYTGAGESGAIRRLSVRVTDREVPVRNLIEMLRAP